MTVEQWLGADNTLGIDIFNHKYLFTDPDTGVRETFDEWLERVSNGDEALKQLILDKKFLFGGRILANRGLNKKGYNVTYSNCYVVTPPEDNIESIFETAKKMARTYSYGGGVGVDISGLAPNGAKVHNASRTSSGACSFMDLYSTTTGLIGQNGRRGALMISLSCEHPDIEEFLDIKKDLNRVTKANISIRMTDEFMKAAKDGKEVELSFTRETGETIKKTVNARDILMHLAENNWEMAEPGCLFWDRIQNWCIPSDDPEFSYAGTNPCAEEPLPAGGSCLLGAINLSEFVDGNGIFQYHTFEKTVKIAVWALNNVLMEGLPLHPLQEQRESVADWVQIGLGIMGLADMLIKMGIRYGSQEAIDICDYIGDTMAVTAIRESCSEAADFGHYPRFNADAVLKSEYLKSHIEEDGDDAINIKKYGLYNSQLLTIAPTGTLSTMLGISGGIEPIFANYYTRKTESLKGHDEYYKVYTPIVQDYMTKHDISDDKDLPDFFITAGELDYKDRIAMQAVWQKHIDAAISSTVNLSNDTTVEDIFDLYIKAWEAGLKGITVFRDGCARAAILSTGTSSEKEEDDISEELPRGFIIPTSDKLIGIKRSITSGCGSLHVEAFFTRDTGELREIYLSKGSKGGCNSFMTGLSRMISLAARGGVPFEDIIDQLHSTLVCPSFATRTATKHDTSRGSSCPNAISYALVEMKADMDAFLKQIQKGEDAGDVIFDEKDDESVAACPVCGSKELRNTEGCVTCPNCGWSRCS